MNQTDRLLKIKSKIEDAKTKSAEIKGQISGIEQQMSSGFKVKGLKEAEKKLSSMETELDKKENEFNTGMGDIEESYDWDK